MKMENRNIWAEEEEGEQQQKGEDYRLHTAPHQLGDNGRAHSVNCDTQRGEDIMLRLHNHTMEGRRHRSIMLTTRHIYPIIRPSHSLISVN